MTTGSVHAPALVAVLLILRRLVSRRQLSLSRQAGPVVLCLLFVCLGASVAGAESDWRVGVAREIITPDQPMWMSGYGSRDRPADGKLTELWAKAIAIEDQAGNRVVLVTLDLVGIDRETAAEIQSIVSERLGLPRKAIAIATSHTHSGPVVGDNLRAMYFLDYTGWQLVRRYTRSLIDKVAQLVERSLADLSPADLAWTVGRAHFAVNRRNNTEKEVPQLRSSDQLLGPVDHDVPILVVRGSAPDDGQASGQAQAVRAVVCGYACHATVLSGYQWCGDWPGYAQEALEKRFEGATAMVWTGCGADQNPLPRRDVELAKQYGQDIDRAVAEALQQPLQPVRGLLASKYAEIPLEFASLPTREQLEQTLSSSNRFEASRAQVLLERWDQDGQLADAYPYPIQSWRLGDGPLWLFLGGEVVVDYALRIKLELGAGRTWVTAYANDVMAYIPSRRVLGEGGYEGGGSMVYYGLPSPWNDQIEQQIMKEVRWQVEDLGGPKADEPRSIQPRPYPDHGDLTVWSDSSGEFHPIRSPGEWYRRRTDVREAMQSVMGRLPAEDELEPLEVEIRETERFDGYQRLLISYRVDHDGKATAHLYLPNQPAVEGQHKRPAVLALHPTSPLGKRIVAGDGPRPNRNYGAELAERGYVVLAPDYPSFGEQTDYNFHTDSYVSGTMRAIVSHRRGVDVLLNREEVDPDRIGVIGHSLGGHNAIFVGVFDERIKAIVSSCGWDPFPYYYGGRLAGWASDRYMPRLREIHGLDPDRVPFDFPEMIASLAPRGFFSCSPLHDSNFDANGVKDAEPKIRDVFRLLGAEENFVVRYPDADHDFPEEVRQEAYEFLDRTLKVNPTVLNPQLRSGS